MFDFLKKKITSWIGKEDKKSKKSGKSKIEKPTKKEKKQKSSKTQTKSEKIQEKEADKLISESEKSINEQIPVPTSESEEPEEEKGNFFTKLLKKITTSKLKQEDFDEAFQDLEITLLENNVALDAVDRIKATLSEQLINQQIRKTEAQARILEALKTSILELLIEPPDLIENIKSHSGTYTILFFGINGTGKTTSIAKLAHLLQKNNISCVLAAGDTFRAASIEQLKTHGERLKIQVISQQYGSDPAAVAFDAKSYAEKHGIKVVLIDTAGRMYTKGNLMKEMEKIVRVSKPNLKLFVGESITGNDAIDQAKTFADSVGIDGIILSKADIDEKAGTILSVSHITKKPIYYLGVGQGYDDLTPFTKKTVLKNLGLE